MIVDEAHSSQSGEAAAEMKGILAKDHIAKQAAEAMEEKGFTEDWQDTMLREMAKRTQQPNLSFFAFTATPKAKTLKVFGTSAATASRIRFICTRCARPSTRDSS